MHHPNQIDIQSSQQLAIQVNGLPLCGGAQDAYTLQSVLDSLTGEQRRLLECIRGAVGNEVGVIDSLFDDTPLLFGQFGFTTRKIAGEDLGTSDLRLVAISCPHRHARLDQVDVDRFLDRGGFLLSSDRAIRLPGISMFLGHLKRRPPARARLSITDKAGEPTSAPVWLDAGHHPLDTSTSGDAPATVMARDALTGDPLVVLVRAGSGGILHSVPHWLQKPNPDLLTSVESRPLQAVPRLRHIGNSYPGINLGAFLAQRSMVDLLIQGLASTLEIGETAEQRQREQGK